MFPEFACDDVFRLETKRLWLRWPCAADAAPLAHHVADRAVAEMTARIPHPYPDGAAPRYIAAARAGNAAAQTLTLVAVFKDTPNTPIGAIGIARGEAPSIGYWVGKPFWRQGLATEAAQAIIDFVFTFTSAPEIAATARVANPASRRVLEKCGFAYFGSGLEHHPARGGMLPCDRFRLDRKVWSSLKGRRMSGLGRESRLTANGEGVACPA